MQLKDVTPIIKAILEERDKIPRIIDKERYIPNPQPYHDGNFMRGGIRKALRIIEQAPVVDAVPVVHGRWVHDDLGHTYCSRCHERLPYIHCYSDGPCSDYDEEWDEEMPESRYCPNCGAKMDAKDMDVPTKDEEE